VRAISSIVIAVVIFAGLALSAAWESGNQSLLQQQIVAKEREELDALKTGNREAFAGLLAEDAVFVNPHGPGTKAEVVEHTAGLRLLEYSMDDVRFVPLSADSGLIAYKLSEKGTMHNHQFTEQVYASALWAKRGDKWVCLFSQETPAGK
jgi:hypothetical protein